MQLYYFLAVILSLSFGSLPHSAHSFQHAVVFSALVIVAWWVLCFLAVRLVGELIVDGEISQTIGCDWFDRQTQCFRWFSLGLIMLCLGGFGLGGNLDHVRYIKHSITLQSLVLLTPAVCMMVGLWSAEWAFDVKYVTTPRTPIRLGAWLFSALRYSIGWLLIPILGFMVLIDLASLTSIGTFIPIWVGWLVLGAVLVAGVPILVRRVFPSMPIEPDTKQWIRSIAAAAGIEHCKIVMWDTGGRTHNAMMAGLLGRFRVLLISDRLVSELSRQELSMVILHEVAHAKRFHVPVRILALVPAWILGAVVGWLLGLLAESGTRLDPLAQWSGTLGSLLSMVGTVLILRLVSYRSEFDADAIACRLAPMVAMHCDSVPTSEAEAGEALASALLHVTAECADSRGPTWLHPGIQDRIQAFSQLSA